MEALSEIPDPPRVETFLGPLDSILRAVRELNFHASLMFNVHTDPETRSVGREVSEASDRFIHEFDMNRQIYHRLQRMPLADQDGATRFAVEKILREMRRAGVERDDATRSRLLELNLQIDSTVNQFGENIARGVRSIVLDSREDLEGLPEDYLAAHPPDSEGKVRITTRYPDFFPAMSYARRSDVRRLLLFEFANQAYPENLPVLAGLLSARQEFAQTLGYPTFAAYATEDKMLKTPEAVHELLQRLGGLLGEPARANVNRLLERKRRDEPSASRLEIWEAPFYVQGYYAELIRREEFDVDMAKLRAYLPYGRIRDGLFDLCERLFGLKIVRSSAAVWHPTVEAYDVVRLGEPLGRFFLDMTPREGKYTHAACFTVRPGDPGIQLPQSALVCNFLAPGTDPGLVRLDYREVVTFFHEFGHLLHFLFAGAPRWIYNSPTDLEWDFIEAPSQLFEEWARDPATLGSIAEDPITGESPPEELLARLKAASSLTRPFQWLVQVALGEVSLDLHSENPTGLDITEATRTAFARYCPVPLPEGYHFEASFGHLTGYSACYYTYAWSAVIARDLLSPFFEKGTLTDPQTAERYAREILLPGSARPAVDIIRTYLGRDFDFTAFEQWVKEPAALPKVT